MAKRIPPEHNETNGQATVAASDRNLDGETGQRLSVLKTYKIYVGGKFPRTESGRFYVVKSPDGRPLANACKCSRKDVRDAIQAARGAQSGWASRSAYNKSQILYRIAEMLEGRKAQFVEELTSLGVATSAATKEVQQAVDRLVYYAGWADKYQQVFASVNPVNSSHFNFSLLEPTGVVTAVCPETPSLLGLVSVVAPLIVGGNSVVALASTRDPLTAVTFGEVLATSDLPGGVVNLLTGDAADMLTTMADHMDVNAIVYAGPDAAAATKAKTLCATNVKRPLIWRDVDWTSDDAQSPYRILDAQEVKTTWHPVGT
ncbi:MAG: aldehyde dehydrogenase family protein [Proteobacteria bacterium]|nr:MAG: aldehyde dehydrogenase family protein [Pseudomonadota bacterium]